MQPEIVSDGNNNGYFALSRPALNDLEERLPRAIVGACMSVMRMFLLEATHTDTPKLKRGCIEFTRHKIQIKTGLSEKQVRRALYELVKQNEVSQIRAKLGPNGGSIFLIVKYDTYDRFSQMRAGIRAELGPNCFYNTNENKPLQAPKEVQVHEVSTSTMQDQKQDQRIDAGASVQPSSNPVSQLGDMVVEMGLPKERGTYSWVGELQKKFGVDVCLKFLEDQKLKGATVTDFKDTRAFKAYFTAAITNRAKEHEVAAATPPLVQWKICNGGDGSPITDPKHRLRYILTLRREYDAYRNLNVDPDKGKPGCTWFVPDEVVQKTIAEAENGT